MRVGLFTHVLLLVFCSLSRLCRLPTIFTWMYCIYMNQPVTRTNAKSVMIFLLFLTVIIDSTRKDLEMDYYLDDLASVLSETSPNHQWHEELLFKVRIRKKKRVLFNFNRTCIKRMYASAKWQLLCITNL